MEAVELLERVLSLPVVVSPEDQRFAAEVGAFLAVFGAVMALTPGRSTGPGADLGDPGPAFSSAPAAASIPVVASGPAATPATLDGTAAAAPTDADRVDGYWIRVENGQVVWKAVRLPTLVQIAAETAEIRAAWSDDDYLDRAGMPTGRNAVHWRPPGADRALVGAGTNKVD